MFEKLTDTLENAIKAGIPGYDCVVYHNGNCVYRHFSGSSSREENIPMNGKEFYNIYSSSKLMTCVAAMQLWEKGLFDLEDDLCKYMPEFTDMNVLEENGRTHPAKNKIKIKHLFTMSAGFNYNLDFDAAAKAKKETGGKCPTREFIKYLAEEPLDFEPGEKWQYSLCHDVLAALIEVLSKEKFGKYIYKNIFEPLGMNNSTFLLDDLELYKISEQYRYNADDTEKISKLDTEADKHRSGGGFENVGKKIQKYKFGTEYESGGAGCISTVDDYIKLLEALRIGNIILRSETFDMMSINQFNDEQLKLFWERPNGYGYGFGFKCPLDSNSLHTNVGWGGAAGSHWFIDKKNGITMCYYQHVLSSPDVGLGENLTRITTEIIKENEK